MDITTMAGLTVALIAFAVLGAFVLSRRRGREEAPEAEEPAAAPSTRRRSLRSEASLDAPMFDEARTEEPVIAHASPEEPVIAHERFDEPVSDYASLDEPAIDHPVLGQMTAGELLHAIAESNAPSPPPAGPRPDAIDAARRHAIVFRTLLPQGPGKDGLSFFGGQPIGPEGFQWPRRHGSEGRPLTFMMQWDCEELAAQDANGLLPTDGVLYCFMDLEWGEGDPGSRIEAFLHHPGPTEGWAEIPLPADAPPIFGDQGMSQPGCTAKVDNARDYIPRMMPRFPFTPVGLDLSRLADLDESDDGNQGGHLFWAEVPSMAEALLTIEKGGGEGGPIPDQPDPHKPFARPFPAYPHDFAAVRHLAARMIGKLDWAESYEVKSAFPGMSDDERRAAVALWTGEARELYRLGCQRPMGTPLDQPIADDIWQWLETRQAIFRSGFDRLALEAVDLSLGAGSAALDRVPQSFIDEAMALHALASESMSYEPYDRIKHGTREEYAALKSAGALAGQRRLHANVPARLLGPPSYVQGDVEELMDEYVLLLELPSHSTPGFALGDGVVQYLIRPDDLAARRFDRVVSVASSY
ncbi:MAG: DUF1963 domain-containing protein [Erythrobacter sp.]